MRRVVWSLGSRTCRRVDEFEERVEGSRSRDAKGRGAVSERSPQLACFFLLYGRDPVDSQIRVTTIVFFRVQTRTVVGN